MSLIGLLGRAGTAFVGGATQQINVNIEQRKKAEAAEAEAAAKAQAEEDKRIAEQTFETSEREAREKSEQEENETNRLAEIGQLKYKNMLEQEAFKEDNQRKKEEDQAALQVATTELEKLQKAQEDPPRYTYSIVKTKTGYEVKAQLTQAGATAIANDLNETAYSGGAYNAVPVLERDVWGVNVLAAAKTKKGRFDSEQAARDFANVQNQNFTGQNDIEKRWVVVPFNEGEGWNVELVKKAPSSAPSSIYSTYAEAEKVRANLQADIDKEQAPRVNNFAQTGVNNPPKKEVVIESIREGKNAGKFIVVVSNVPEEPLPESKSESGPSFGAGYYAKLFAFSGGDNSPENVQVVPLVPGLPMSGSEQKNTVLGQDYFVFNTSSPLSDSTRERSFDLIRRWENQLSPELLAVIDNIENPRVKLTAQTRLSGALNAWAQGYQDVTKTVTETDVTAKDPMVAYPWLAERAKNSKTLRDILQSIPAFRFEDLPEDVPKNTPVDFNPDGSISVKRIDNLDQSPFLQQDSSGETGVSFTAKFLSPLMEIQEETGVKASKLITLIHANENADGIVTRTSINEAFTAITTLQSILSEESIRNEGGGYANPLSSLTDQSRDQLKGALTVFSDYSARVMAIRAAFPSKNSNTMNNRPTYSLIQKNNTPSGMFMRVTGLSETDFRDIGVEAANANRMLKSIDEIKRAISDTPEGKASGVGAALAVQSVKAGIAYLATEIANEFRSSNEAAADRIMELQKNVKDNEGNSTEEKNALLVLYGTMISYQLARMLDPNGRLSDEDRKTVEKAMALTSLSATPDKLLIVVNKLEETARYVAERNAQYRSGIPRNIMAAKVYDELGEGENIQDFFAGLNKETPPNTGLSPDKNTTENMLKKIDEEPEQQLSPKNV